MIMIIITQNKVCKRPQRSHGNTNHVQSGPIKSKLQAIYVYNVINTL